MRSRVSSPSARNISDRGFTSRSVALDSTEPIYHALRMSSSAADRLAALCKGLAHPARVRIVAEGDASCGALVATCSLAQSTVSQHLAVLAHAGLVRRERDSSYC